MVDSGASCIAMSFKFSQTETIRSLKLVFKGNKGIINLANNTETTTHGQLKNVPVTVNNMKSSVNPHVMSDLSYDLILGREWCEANGVVIDFSKKKIYFLKPQVRNKNLESMNNMDEQSDHKNDEDSEQIEESTINEHNPQEYAQLENKISIKPYHEVLLLVKSEQKDSNVLFVKSYDPLVARCGIFVTKGICQFNNSQAYLVLANLTSKVVTLPAGIIIASLEIFNEDEYETHEWTGMTDTEKAEQEETEKNRKFVVVEPNLNKFLNWKPIIKRSQHLIIDYNRKLVKIVDV